jgi:pimeloyl-ACP methyl ester carboxylesterase
VWPRLFPTPVKNLPNSSRRGERRALLTSDGVRVVAEHLPARDNSRELVVVVAHGFTHHSRHPALRQVATWLEANGVVLVDLRGHGASAGWSTGGDAEIYDVAAAVQWARTMGYQRVATLGFSLGAAVVLRHAALTSSVDAVAAVSGPGLWYFRGTTPMRWVHRGVETRLGRTLLRLWWRTRVMSRPWVPPYPLAPAEAAARIDVPLLLVHGSLDRYFPIDHAVALSEAAGERAELWLEEGYGHGESALSPELAARIAAWLREAATREGGVPWRRS